MVRFFNILKNLTQAYKNTRQRTDTKTSVICEEEPSLETMLGQFEPKANLKRFAGLICALSLTVANALAYDELIYARNEQLANIRCVNHQRSNYEDSSSFPKEFFELLNAVDSTDESLLSFLPNYPGTDYCSELKQIVNNTPRTIKIGLSYDRVDDPEKFKTAISAANKLLKRYNVSVDLDEEVQNNNTLKKLSEQPVDDFSRAQDLYFVHIEGDWDSKRRRNKNIFLKNFKNTQSHVCFMDAAVNEQDLAKIIALSTLRLFHVEKYSNLTWQRYVANPENILPLGSRRNLSETRFLNYRQDSNSKRLRNLQNFVKRVDLNLLSEENKTILEEIVSLRTDCNRNNECSSSDKATTSDLENYETQLKNILSSAKRTINVGLALNGVNSRRFKKALKQANKQLDEYGLTVKLGDRSGLDYFTIRNMPKQLTAPIAPDAFSEYQDISFIHTRRNYSGKINPSYFDELQKSSGRECIIDRNVSSRKLSNVIVREVLSLVAGEKITSYPGHANYFTKTPPNQETIEKHILDRFESSKNQTDTTFNKLQKRDVLIGLDGVSEEYAKNLLKKASKIFTEKFGISLNPVYFSEYEGFSGITGEEPIENLIRDSKQKSHIQLFFTNKPLRNGYNKNEHILGQAYVKKGHCFVEVRSSEELVLSTLLHELAHLYDALHNKLRNNSLMSVDSVRNPFHKGTYIWTTKTTETILKNRIKHWSI